MFLFVAGSAVRLAGLFELVRAAGSSGRSRSRGRSVFDTRFFRLCRHPRYLATLVQLVGSALVFNSWGGLVLVVLLGLPLILFQVRAEDAALERAYRAEFKSYAERVPLFWPRLRRP